MISFWRSYAAAAAWSVVILPVALALFFLGSGLLSGAGRPSGEALIWAGSFAVFLFLPLMGAVDLIVAPAWILWRRSKARSVSTLGAQAALFGTAMAFAAFFAYR
ncbi:hypothetical protein GCM10010435_24170 [Winogradskya consettensis]|uniref:Uncharacterized protein n=1 Tax=Winogradskya consettensis TaxID=113560 RepID=A0A919T2G6_9ACTN|nr:hypothetical protein [Actinoplanes consettensis]GIM82440.1 hypothetical protein Aco04nite_81490 [Actinoplanes consettensis]